MENIIHKKSFFLPSPYRWVSLFFIGVVLLFSTACSEITAPVQRVPKQVVDSIARARIDSLRPIMDSICRERTARNIEHLADSMLTIRLEDMRKRLNVIK
jgi:hypothetical protein